WWHGPGRVWPCQNGTLTLSQPAWPCAGTTAPGREARSGLDLRRGVHVLAVRVPDEEGADHAEGGDDHGDQEGHVRPVDDALHAVLRGVERRGDHDGDEQGRADGGRDLTHGVVERRAVRDEMPGQLV